MGTKKTKKKKNANKDFQKVKLKAGKTAKPSNITDTNMKTKSVQIIQKVSDYEKMTTTQIISQTLHHSAQMRKSAIQILQSKIESHDLSVSETAVISCLGRLLADDDHFVRLEAGKVLKSYHEQVYESVHENVVDQLLAYTNVGLTSPCQDTQRNSIDFLSSILCNLPENSFKLLELISRILALKSNPKFHVTLINFIDKLMKELRLRQYKKQLVKNEIVVEHDCAMFELSTVFVDEKQEDTSFYSLSNLEKLLDILIDLFPDNEIITTPNKEAIEQIGKIIRSVRTISQEISSNDALDRFKSSVSNLFPIRGPLKLMAEITRVNFDVAKLAMSLIDDDLIRIWIREENVIIRFVVMS